jgi:hypothetical protein
MYNDQKTELKLCAFLFGSKFGKKGINKATAFFHKDFNNNDEHDHLVPNVVVEWLALLLLIQGVLFSDLGPETGYPV